MKPTSGLHWTSKVYRQLSRSWHDPRASEVTAGHYRGRQLLAILKLMPMSASGTYAIVLASIFTASQRHAQSALIIFYEIALTAIGSITLWAWWRTHNATPARFTATHAACRWLALTFGAGALLYGLVTLHLFAIFDDRERAVLIAVVAAVIGVGGWMFSPLPLAGVLWAVFFCATVGVGMLLRFNEGYGVLAPLLLFYGVFLIGTILITSRAFVAGLISETRELEQRDVVGLLLRDFEASASDWLWEIDAQTRLIHVSARLAQALSSPARQLVGCDFFTLISGLTPEPTAEQHNLLSRWLSAMAQRKAFTGLIVPASNQGKPCWWALTAKPLVGEGGAFIGWRGVGSDVTVSFERDKAMERLANTDTLTGLANRNKFRDSLDQFFPPLADTLLPCTLFILDLDNFKSVNDSLGHLAGDELLQEVAQRFKTAAGSSGLAARLEGDEFAWLVPGLLPRAKIELMWEQLRHALAVPWLYQAFSVEIRASVGVAFALQDGDSAVELLRAADMALFAAKSSGRDALRFFEPNMAALMRQKMNILNDLRKGIDEGQFRVYYQPLMDLASGALAGFEALIRWQHPRHGLVLPGEFIELAEESGLIVPLGEWVLNQACWDASRWPPELCLSVNVSAVQIERSDILATVQTSLRRSGLPASRLELELTESSLMRDNQAALALLHAFRELGVRLALDDFGTGYSSLSYLRSFPLDKLKIDQSFLVGVGDPDADGSAAAIVATIVQLARILKLQTTAEGIETPQQHAVMTAMNCTYGQGYLYAVPLDFSGACKLVQEAMRPGGCGINGGTGTLVDGTLVGAPAGTTRRMPLALPQRQTPHTTWGAL